MDSKNITRVFVVTIALWGLSTYAAEVNFKMPKDGAKIKNPVVVKMEVHGLKVRPAGEDVNDRTSGHHHLIVDGEPIAEGQVVPTIENKVMHFGKGQTETKIELTPGSHTLTLQFADGAHKSYGPALSKTIKIEVEKDTRQKNN